ncbi:calmodulin-like [Ruditapes philippinarum]|uniref:calmodulin-like n=1 Tax=Ruditapes philippinarum TaxID=129788 RepID=UPI00295BAC05|nr:calmodulin-like [Ruditapes philippinarum]
MVDHFNEEDISYMFEVFRQYDTDRNGQIKITDLSHAMLSLGHNPTLAELDKLVNAIERQEDRDYLDFPEFLTVLAFHLQETEPEEQLREAFKVFDKDGNGKLNANELKQSMTNLGERLSKEDIEYMIKMADVTGDGNVNYEEFIRVMTSK